MSSDWTGLLFDYGIDINRRRIYFHADIHSPYELDDPTKSPMNSIFRGFSLFESLASKDPVELWINTPGGSVDEMFAIYDQIQNCTYDVITIGTGIVASAGSLILSCGKKRYITDNCVFMYHGAAGGGDDYIEILEDRLKFWKDADNRMCQLMEKHTTKNAKFWANLAKKKGELWIYPEKLKEYGVIDGIYGTDYTSPVITKRRRTKKKITRKKK